MKGYTRLLVLVGFGLAFGAGVYRGAELGAELAIEEGKRQVEELGWWDKFLLGIGVRSLDDVIDVEAARENLMNGSTVGRPA